jgi:hypothetical protein
MTICCVFDRKTGDFCLSPVVAILAPGNTFHCEEHGPKSPLYSYPVWQDAFDSGKAFWIYEVDYENH